MYLLLILTIVPTIILLAWIYHLDRFKREPSHLLARVFFWGIMAVFGALIVDILLIDVFGIENIDDYWLKIAVMSFVTAALVEESVKFLVVYYFAYKEKAFDELIDGIVYSVVASLGFATFENIFYVFDSTEGGVVTAFVRGFLSVPGHAFDGAIMGYYIGLARFASNSIKEKGLLIKGLLLAILFHGLYDFFIFSESLIALLVIPLLTIQAAIVFHAIKIASKKEKRDFLHLLNLFKAMKHIGFWGISLIVVGFAMLMFAIVMLIGVWVQILEHSLIFSEELLFILLVVVLPGVLGIMFISKGLKTNSHEKVV